MIELEPCLFEKIYMLILRFKSNRANTASENVQIKELSLCHKLCFSKPYIFGFQCRRP